MRKLNNAIGFAPLYNHKGHDATGAFHPKSARWAKIHGLAATKVVRFDNNAAPITRAAQVLSELAKAHSGVPFDSVAFFCHGLRSGIQAGFDVRNVRQLAATIARLSTPDVVVPLFCCSTGGDRDGDSSNDMIAGIGGDGGFADLLRDALAEAGAVRCDVFAHVNPGHTTTNPWVRQFTSEDTTAPAKGGHWYFHPDENKELWTLWRARVTADGKNDHFDLRYPYMTRQEVLDELRKPVAEKPLATRSKKS